MPYPKAAVRRERTDGLKNRPCVGQEVRDHSPERVLRPEGPKGIGPQKNKNGSEGIVSYKRSKYYKVLPHRIFRAFAF